MRAIHTIALLPVITVRIALRCEARDFYSGSPGYNLASLSGGQHNVFAGGAVVLRWH